MSWKPLNNMCPRCRSRNLWIKEKTLWELVLSATSGERTYLCKACLHNFRAPGRPESRVSGQLEGALATNSSVVGNLWAE
ncbi:MAG: hypothetical protein JWN34_1449 [Bryobacterales bacterium]|nr:hypothetical protein [Bryobacterales bacterium]